MPFSIKQNDRRPYISGQILQPDGTTGLDLSLATAVKFVMKASNAAEGTAPKIKGDCNLIDEEEGIWRYEWQEGDTATVGTFRAEIEIDWNGELQTVPVNSYFDVIVVDDLG